MAKLASKEAVAKIITYEVGSKSDYDSHQTPHLDSDGSVTIGIGYDLGFVTAEQFDAAWGNVLKAEDLNVLKAYVDSRHPSLSAMDIARLARISIPYDQAISVLLNTTLSKSNQGLRQVIQNLDDLPPESYGALLTLVYLRGASFTLPGDRFVEMREIKRAMDERGFDRIPGLLRQMAERQTINPVIQRRYKELAQLFESGFSSRSTAQ